MDIVEFLQVVKFCNGRHFGPIRAEKMADPTLWRNLTMSRIGIRESVTLSHLFSACALNLYQRYQLSAQPALGWQFDAGAADVKAMASEHWQQACDRNVPALSRLFFHSFLRFPTRHGCSLEAPQIQICSSSCGNHHAPLSSHSRTRPRLRGKRGGHLRKSPGTCIQWRQFDTLTRQLTLQVGIIG